MSFTHFLDKHDLGNFKKMYFKNIWPFFTFLVMVAKKNLILSFFSRGHDHIILYVEYRQ
jgi:hypothetical protein